MNLIQAGREMLKGKVLLESNGYRYRLHNGDLEVFIHNEWTKTTLRFTDVVQTTFDEIKEKEETQTKRCFIDGTCLCVVGKDFVNLQESKAVFIELTPGQIKDIEGL